MQITVLSLKTHGYICHFDLNNIILFLEFSESIAIYSVNFTNSEHNNAMYYSYHATAKHLIRSGKLTDGTLQNAITTYLRRWFYCLTTQIIR